LSNLDEKVNTPDSQPHLANVIYTSHNVDMKFSIYL